jgi:uncharacterized protein DUF4384
MMLPLLLSLIGSAPANAAVAPSDDPPIKVWLNQDNYFQRGDKARVNVKLSEDGYLVVLRADPAGRVRVLFPLDPSDDDFVRGGDSFEVRGRGDREAFSIDEREGTGVVLAARSAVPLKFDEFVRGDHWDYGVLDARSAGDDKEAALLDLVQRMTPDGHFDYDVQKYFIASPRAYDNGYYPSFGIGLGYGWPYYGYRFGFAYGRYNSCFDPFFYDPFFCDSFFYDPFFYNPFFYGSFGYVYRPFIYRPFGFNPGGFGRFGGGPFFKNPPGTNATRGIGPRLRIPQGVLMTRAVSAGTGIGVRTRDAALGEPRVREQSFGVRERNDRPRGDFAPVPRSTGRRDAGRGAEGSVAPQRRSGGGGGGGGGRVGGGGGGGGGGGRVGGSSGGHSFGGGHSAPSRSGGGGGGRSGGGGGGGRRGH